MRFLFYKVTVLLLITLVSLIENLRAFDNNYLVSYYSVNEGLSHNIINSMVIDTVGFLWIGSENGLNRYDGSIFKVYKVDSKFGGLKSNAINKLLIDSKGRLWVGANDGVLMRYNYSNDSFEQVIVDSSASFDSNIIDIKEDKHGKIWVATYGAGVYVLNADSQNLKKIDTENSSLETDEILCLEFDSEGYAWLGTEGHGLYKYDVFIDSLQHIDLHKNKQSVYHKLAILSLKSVDNRLLIGTYGSGVLAYDTQNKHITEFSINTGYPLRYVKDIAVKGEYVYVGTRADGIVRFNLKTAEYDQLTLEADKDLTLTNPSVLSICIDVDGNVWMGTEGGGVNVLAKRSFTFNDFPRFTDSDLNVSVVYRDAEGDYWIGTYGNGTYQLNSDYELKQHFVKGSDKQICSNTIRSICQDKRGNYWFGSDSDGLCWYNPQADEFKHYSAPDSDTNKNTISNRSIHCIYTSDKNTVWFGTWGGGLCRYSYISDEFETYQIDKELSKNIVIDIYQSSADTLWLATRGNGLVRFLVNDAEMKYYQYSSVDKSSISNNYVTSISGDGDGQLWLSTAGGGLNSFSISDESFEFYSEADGLSNDVIPCMCDDNNGNLWLATINGLSVFLKRSKRFYNFGIADRLNNLSYNPSACFKDSENVIYMPGNKGIDCIRSANFNKQEEYLKPVITEVFVDNEIVHTSYNNNGIRPLNRNTVIADSLLLMPGQKSVSFNVSALSLLDNNTAFFRYKLKSEKAWNYKSGKRIRINYSSLDEGHNVLFVEVGTSGDSFIGKKVFNIVVSPPFYKTGWFWVIVTLIFITILFVAIRLQNSILKSKNQELEACVRTRTAEIQRQKNELEKQSKKILSQQEQILDVNKLLEEQNAELDKHRQNLEKLVVERTKELLAALDKAKESDKLKTAFLTNISHEIRTPLNSIIGFSDLLTQFDDFTTEKRNVFISAIQRNGDTLIRLIDDIIELAKFESQQIDIKYKLFRLEPLMDKMYVFLRDKIHAESKSLEIRLDVSRLFKELTLYCDEFRIEQVLINLIDNAVKYTEDGMIEIGYDVVESEFGDSSVLFFVRDTGVGIEKKNQKKIFERFHKVAISNMKLYRGTGLGLALSKYVVEAMGGNIWVESEIGSGASFFFTVPIKSDNNVEDSKFNLSGRKILVAEDEEYNFNLIRESLAFTKADFYNATNGVEAVAFAKELCPDLILMDIRMPKADGYQATSEIRQFDQTVPIIAQTAYAMSSELSMMLSSGFTAVVTKPIDFVRLLSEMKKCLNLP